jgi:hypothetical protein|tara:strand:- start:3525 stop:4451 length:927 start_codon:yes stop_codon:yes gene_type:complete
LKARLNRPWLHFLIVGVVFYQVQAIVFPEPKTVIGPLSESVHNALQQQWLTRFGNLPTAKQKTKMIADELDRDLLFQRALELHLHLHDSIVFDQLIRNMRFLDADTKKTSTELFQVALDMRLHLGDEVVKRRLIEKMKQRLLTINPPIEVTETQIAAEFIARKHEFYRSPRYSFAHVFISSEREAELKSVIKTIQDQRLTARTARYLSSPFMSGYEFQAQTAEQLTRNFGVLFISDLAKLGPVVGQWYGPIRSSFGWHYLWISAIEQGRDARLDEVTRQLRYGLEVSARERALQTAMAALRSEYEVRQ